MPQELSGQPGLGVGDRGKQSQAVKWRRTSDQPTGAEGFSGAVQPASLPKRETVGKGMRDAGRCDAVVVYGGRMGLDDGCYADEGCEK